MIGRSLMDILAEHEQECAEASREEALLRVERNADEQWLAAALDVVFGLAERHDEFTTDEVWAVLEAQGVGQPHETRAMGAVMRRAARLGFVTKTDRVRNSLRVECHARPVAVWASLCVREES